MDKEKAVANSSPGRTIANSPHHKSRKTTASSSSERTIVNGPQQKNEREKLIEKARQVLPEEVFSQIQKKTVDHKEIISKIISENKRDIIVTNRNNPRIFKFLRPGKWEMKEFDWGITRQVIFRQLDRTEWIKFPAIIKYLLNGAVDRNNTHISFELFSTIGWREETKFFQPYQIWSFDSFRSCHLLNPGFNNEAMNHEGYWMNSFIELVKEARHILKSFDDYFIMTDGRRIFSTKITYKSQFEEINHTRTREEIYDARTLLRKLAFRQDMLDVPTTFRWFTNNISKRPIHRGDLRNGIQPLDFVNQQ
jgi:hypothetical protein